MSSFALRRWFQIRLRTVLVLVLVASLPLARLGMRLDRIRRQQPAIVAVEEGGGAVWIVREPPTAATPAIPGRSSIYDSQRQESSALQQVVEDAQYGEVVCVAFGSAMPNFHDFVGENGAVNVDGQEVVAGSLGTWVLHGDSRGLWPGRQQPATPPPFFAWETLNSLPYLPILDLGDRPLEVDQLTQISRFTNLRALLARSSKVTDKSIAFAGRLENLRILSLGQTSVTDEGLRHLANLHELEVMELDGAQIHGGGLKYLAGLSHLKLLSLRHTPLTDEGLEQLAGLSEMRRLYLYDTAVTDAGLAKLRPLNKLEILHLGKTSVTFEAANEFEKDLPRRPIIR